MIGVIQCTSAADVMAAAARCRAYRAMVFARPPQVAPPAPVKPFKPQPVSRDLPIVSPRRVRRVIDAVAAHLGVEAADILGRNRLHKFVRARHVLTWLLRRERGMSFPEIARRTNREDHTTALAAFRKVDADPYLKALAMEIAAKLAEGVDHG